MNVELALGRESDSELMRRVQARDHDAFRKLVERYRPIALVIARRIVGDAFLAQEAVQEAFAQSWSRRASYDPSRGSVRAWILSLVHHRSVDLIRREQAQLRRALEMIDAVDATGDDPGLLVTSKLDASSDRERVVAAVERLAPKHREVIHLMYFTSMSQSQVAAALGIPLGTVKTRAMKAMRRLRSALDAEGAQDTTSRPVPLTVQPERVVAAQSVR